MPGERLVPRPFSAPDTGADGGLPQEEPFQEISPLSDKIVKELRRLRFDRPEVIQAATTFFNGLSDNPNIAGVGVVYRDIGVIRPFIDVTLLFDDRLDLSTEEEDMQFDTISEQHGDFSIQVGNYFHSILGSAYASTHTPESFHELLIKQVNDSLEGRILAHAQRGALNTPELQELNPQASQKVLKSRMRTASIDYQGEQPPIEISSYDVENWSHWAIWQHVRGRGDRAWPLAPRDGFFEGYHGTKHEWVDLQNLAKSVIVGRRHDDVANINIDAPLYVIAEMHQDTDIDPYTRVRRHREEIVGSIEDSITPEGLRILMGIAYEMAYAWKAKDIPLVGRRSQRKRPNFFQGLRKKQKEQYVDIAMQTAEIEVRREYAEAEADKVMVDAMRVQGYTEEEIQKAIRGEDIEWKPVREVVQKSSVGKIRNSAGKESLGINPSDFFEPGEGPSASGVRTKDTSKIPVSSIIYAYQYYDGDIKKVAETRGISQATVEAALLYYQRNKIVIDDKLDSNAGARALGLIKEE